MLAARRRLPCPLRQDLDTSDYRVFDHPARVPWPVWHNRHFVVERFLPERDGDLYCLRTWTFLGDAYTHSRCWSPAPIIKARNVVRPEVLGEVPDELWRLRRELGFDYGKFDYVVHDGRVGLYDANRTPAARHLPGSVVEPNIHILAAGLGALMRTSP